MNINLLGIKTSPAGRALIASAWRNERLTLLITIVEIHVKWILLTGLVVLSSVSLCILPLPFGDTELMTFFIGCSGLNYAVIYQVTLMMAAIAYGTAVLLTALEITHRCYQAAELGYSSFRRFNIDSRPELRLALLKFQKKDMAQTDQRGGTPE